MPQIVLENLTKRFGKTTAVDDVSMTIDDKAFVSLLGPSGCGKTTILRMITGFEVPTKGNIYIDGNLVFSSEKGINVPASKRGIGFLFQNYALWPHMTVYKNISFGLENMKLPKDEIRSRVGKLMEMLQISEFEKRYPSELSGGQQQRVAIARTLSMGSKILFMDEPLSNLDAKLRNEMRVELKRLHEDTGCTFIYVTHDQLEAMTLSTKICLLQKGVIQQYDTPLKVYNESENVFVAGFVGNPSSNFIPATVSHEGAVCKVSTLGKSFLFVPNESAACPEGKVTLGVRPEFIKVDANGYIESKVFSTLPSGMETIVKSTVGDTMITSVQFGAVNYKSNENLNLDIIGSNVIVYDETTQRKAAVGALKKDA